MWRSSKDMPRSGHKGLPSSSNQLTWAKEDRAIDRTQFRVMTMRWTTLTRPPSEADVAEVGNDAAPVVPTFTQPDVRRKIPMYYRTSVVRRKKPK